MSQKDLILKHLKHSPITRLDAIQRYGILNLWARISDAEATGVKINRKWVTVKNRYGETCRVMEYRLG